MIKKDIAYQLQSNYHSIFLECMDNYTISDYVNHSASYYASKLDEFMNDDNYATVILSLIQMQYDDGHNDKIKLSQDSYYPIYDYLSKMYYKKYITPYMSYREAKGVADYLVERVMFDVPSKYEIDTSRFYSNLDEYCISMGISIGSKTL